MSRKAKMLILATIFVALIVSIGLYFYQKFQSENSFENAAPEMEIDKKLRRVNQELLTLENLNFDLQQSINDMPQDLSNNKNEDVKTYKNKVLQEVDRRSVALNNLFGPLGSAKKISENEKNKFETEIKANLTLLRDLRIKIQKVVDSESLTKYINTINDSYNVFSYYLPKIKIISTAERQMLTLNDLKEVVGLLDEMIKQAEVNGRDVLVVKSKYDELQSKIKLVEVDSQIALDLALNLELSGFPGNKNDLNTAVGKLRGSYTTLGTAIFTAQTIRNQL